MCKRLVIIISLLVLSLIYLWQTSWLGVSSWQDASGWSKVPMEQKRIYDNKSHQAKIYWLGHASFLIKTRNLNILLDPNFSERCTIVHRATKSFIKPIDLPRIDAVLLSHTHYDHLDYSSLEGIKNLGKIIIANKSEVFLPKGLKGKAVRLNLWQNYVLSDQVKVIATPAVHNGARKHPFKSDYNALGYIIEDGEDVIYFAGDTGWGTHFEEIKKRYSPNITIIPIGGYEPYFILKNYHLSPEDAVRAANVIGSSIVIPAHFGTFRVALDPTNWALPKFFNACKASQLNCQLSLFNMGKDRDALR